MGEAFDALKVALMSERPQDYFQQLDNEGSLVTLYPELAALKGCEQDPRYHPEGDAFNHTVLCLALGARNEKRTPEEMYGIMCHDLGKSKARDPEKQTSYPNHDRLGAPLAIGMSLRIGATKGFLPAALIATEYHMKFWEAPVMKPSKTVKMLTELGCLVSDYNLDLLANVCYVDDLVRPEHAGHWQHQNGVWAKFIAYYKQCSESISSIDEFSVRGKNRQHTTQIVHEARIASVADWKKSFWD